MHSFALYYLVKSPEPTHFCSGSAGRVLDGSFSSSAVLSGPQEEHLDRLQDERMPESGQSGKKGRGAMCFFVYGFLLVKTYPTRKTPHTHFCNAIFSDLDILQGS